MMEAVCAEEMVFSQLDVLSGEGWI
jgi:hypothetical protein